MLTRDLLHDPLDGCLGEGGPAEHLVPVELPLREVGDEHLHPLTLLPLLLQATPLLLLTTLLLRQGLLKQSREMKYVRERKIQIAVANNSPDE